MKITRATFNRIDGYPVCDLVVDGVDTGFSTQDQKPIFTDRGHLYLTGFEDRVPPWDFPGDSELGVRPRPMPGFVSDPLLLKLWDRYLKAVQTETFQPGEIDLAKL